MQFTRIVLVLVILWHKIANVTNQYNVPTSPCPQIFQYKFDGTNWIGEIKLSSPPLQQSEVVVQVTLSVRGATTVRTVFYSTVESVRRKVQF